MIDLNNLVELHDNSKSIRRHKRILEELFYLCINDTFEATIQNSREELRAMSEDVYIEFPCNRDLAIKFRNSLSMAQLENDYRSLLLSISERHGYYHPSFTRNYRQIASDSDTREMFNILENIIFFNNPIPNNNPKDHFKSRSGYVEIAHDEIEGPYIRMHFDLGTTRKEIIDIIDKSFPETASLQEQVFNIPKKQYRIDPSLKTKLIIRNETGKKRNDTQIAITLEAEGLYTEENTGDSVRMQRARMDLDISRFNANE